jgi:hypothetical protein
MRRLVPLVVLMFVGCGGKSFIPPPPPSDADREVAANFLKLIREGKTDAAWTGTSAEFKSFMGKAEFAKFVKDHPQLKQPAEAGEVTTTNDAIPLARCKFRTTGAKPATVTVTLGREGDAWKVAGIQVE